MPVTLSCACGAKLSVPDSMAGKAGACPTCGASISVPTAGAGSAFDLASRDLTGSRDLAVSDDAADDAPAPPKRVKAEAPSMRFRCPSCKRTLRVALRFAGQTGKCAGCGASFTAPVPAQVKPSAPPAPSLRAAFSFEKIRCACGVTFARGRADGECPACGRLLPADSSG